MDKTCIYGDGERCNGCGNCKKDTVEISPPISVTINTENMNNALSDKIITEVVKQISEKFIENNSKKVMDKINYQTDLFIENILTAFLDRNILITDKWGDEKARYENVEEMLREKFDNFITEQVDGKGAKTNSCSYESHSRIEHMIEKKLKKEYEHKFSNAIYSAVTKVKTKVIEEHQKIFNEKMIASLAPTITELIEKQKK